MEEIGEDHDSISRVVDYMKHHDAVLAFYYTDDKKQVTKVNGILQISLHLNVTLLRFATSMLNRVNEFELQKRFPISV